MKCSPKVLFATGSAALCVAVLIVWARSYWIADGLMIGPRHAILSGWGKLMAWRMDPPPGQAWNGPRFAHVQAHVDDILQMASMIHDEGQWTTNWNFGGFHLWIGRTIASSGQRDLLGLTIMPCRILIVPDWLLAVVFGFPSLTYIGGWYRRRRRRLRHLCVRCGYDLRASGETCPECGTPISKER